MIISVFKTDPRKVISSLEQMLAENYVAIMHVVLKNAIR